MKKKAHIPVSKVDFYDFKYELERAVLATNRESSQQCLTRAKFLCYLLCRNLGHHYVQLFDETFNSADDAVRATANKREKTRQFRNHFSRLKHALYDE
jgi:hypothetical protein